MERITFVVMALALLATLLFMEHKRKQARFHALFAFCLLCCLGFYLIQFGGLGEFSIKGFSTSADFVRDKVTEAQTASTEIAELQAKSAKYAAEIESNANIVQGIRSDLEKLEKDAEPRTITSEQHDTFVDSQKNAPKGDIVIVIASRDGETLLFSNEIQAMLTDAGYIVSLKGQPITPFFTNFETPTHDVSLALRYTPGSSTSFDWVKKGFTAIGLRVDYIPEGFGGTLFLVITDKHGQ